MKRTYSLSHGEQLAELFSTDLTEFVSLSTATVAPPDDADDLPVLTRWKMHFKKSRLDTDISTVEFHDK